MTPAQTQLARKRLWLGITNVGCWVLAACAGLAWLVIGAPTTAAPQTLCVVGIGALLVQAAFDFLGGFTFMPAPRPTVATFLRRWVRGIFGHTLVLIGVGVVSAASLRFTGGFAAGIGLATALLALGRRPLLWLIGGATIQERPHEGEPILTAAVDDPAFTGGVAGLRRNARSLLPARWLTTLPKAELATEIARRRWQIAHALPARSFAVVLLWNVLGTSLGTPLLHLADRPLALALLGHACWMTLWTFASLLVLPGLSRRAVFAADRAAAEAGQNPRAWITRFPELVGEDGSPRASVQTIFYPIPAATLRLRALESPELGLVLGNLARTNLYASWATCTLLGRAVHCNVGRPALWVFPPAA